MPTLSRHQLVTPCYSGLAIRPWLSQWTQVMICLFFVQTAISGLQGGQPAMMLALFLGAVGSPISVPVQTGSGVLPFQTCADQVHMITFPTFGGVEGSASVYECSYCLQGSPSADRQWRCSNPCTYIFVSGRADSNDPYTSFGRNRRSTSTLVTFP